ncbi:MAG: hypothetical protein HY843_04530, partial [Bdellovibrio sp.]|nr:hypothetical protein [Bdellovibrio sp.]
KIFIESKNGQWILETRASLSCNSWDYKINLISPEKKETGFHCPEVFDQDTKNGFYPFFISNITSYFQSKSHPDLLVIANPNTSFNKQYTGDHGGPTLEETIVPVLTRNAEISPPSSVITTRKILSFLNLKSKFSKFSIITEGLPSISAFMPVTYISTQPNQQKKTTLNQIEVGTPLSSFIVKNESERVTTSWQPGLEIEWSQKWTNFFNSSLKYQLQYINFLSDNSNLKYQSSYFLHGLAFGLGYRYGEKENLYLLGILKENYFLENPQELRKLWTPELALETKMRLYSFGLGDINLKGALGFLFSTGLREMMGIGIEAPIQTTDTMGVYFRFQHFNQNINQSHQSTFMYELVFTYGLSFLN